MIGSGLPRATVLVLLCALGACAEPVNDLTVGTGGAAIGSCQAPACGACSTCTEMCLCSGSALAKCQAICASGSGGSATGGSGGYVATGGSGASAGSGATGGFGGTGGYGATGGYAGSGGAACSVQVGDPTCDACIGSSCCTEAEACAYDANCGGLMNCLSMAPECQSAQTLGDLLACADTACPAYAAGKTSFSGYLSCMSVSCASACGS